jgi:hypothetical protein
MWPFYPSLLPRHQIFPPSHLRPPRNDRAACRLSH